MKKIFLISMSLVVLIFLASCTQVNNNFDGDFTPNTNTSTNTSTSTGTETSTNTNTSTNTSTSTGAETSTNTNTDTNTGSDTENSIIIPPGVSYDFLDEIGLIYKLKDDQTLAVIGYYGKAGSFIIPEEYNGYTVTEIGEYAFEGYEEIAATVQSNIGFVTISIPGTVNKISKGAFSRCDDIKPQYYKGTSTLSRSEWLKLVVIEEENEHVRDVIDFNRPAIGWNIYVKP